MSDLNNPSFKDFQEMDQPKFLKDQENFIEKVETKERSAGMAVENGADRALRNLTAKRER